MSMRFVPRTFLSFVVRVLLSTPVERILWMNRLGENREIMAFSPGFLKQKGGCGLTSEHWYLIFGSKARMPIAVSVPFRSSTYTRTHFLTTPRLGSGSE